MVRIPQLPEQSTGNLSASDYFPVYDAESDSTKKLSWPNLIIALGSSFGSSIAGTVTGSKVVVSTGTNTIGESSVTTTELAYLSGVTGGIQAQINGLAAGNVSAAPLLAPTTDVRNVIQPGNATSPNLILKLAASQTARPLRLESSSGTLLLSAGTNGQLISNVPTGTSPLSVDSTTLVANLNADTVDGLNASAFVLNSGYSLGQLLRGTGGGGLLSALDAGASGQVVGYTTGGALTSITLGSAAMSSTGDFAAASHNQSISTILTGTATGANAEYIFTRIGGSALSGTVEVSAGSAGFALITRDNTDTRTAWIAGNGTITARSLTTTITGGSPPIDVGSNTNKCTSLNADTVDGYDFDTGYSAGVILAGTGPGGALSKLNLGTSGQVLTATSGTGLVWLTPSGGGSGATSARLLFPSTALDSIGTNGASLLNLGDATTARMCRGFDDTTECYAYGQFQVPSNINTSGTVSFSVMGGLRSSTTGNLLWTFGERESATGEAWTGAYTEYDSASTAISGATTTQTLISWSTTASTLGWQSGDLVRFRVSRDPGVSGDASGDALLDLFYIDIPLA